MDKIRKKRNITDHQKEYIKAYNRENRMSISFRLSRLYDAKYIEMYQAIPDKNAWFKWALKKWNDEVRSAEETAA